MIEHFVYRIGLSAGMLAAALGGLDAFVFTAGIGENSYVVADGTNRPYKCKIRAPSFAHLQAMDFLSRSHAG